MQTGCSHQADFLVYTKFQDQMPFISFLSIRESRLPVSSIKSPTQWIAANDKQERQFGMNNRHNTFIPALCILHGAVVKNAIAQQNY